MTFRLAIFALASTLIGAQNQGSVMAPVTVEIYSDYSCPHCRAFHEDQVKQLTEEFVMKNKVKIVYRDYLLGHFKYSHEAALWANAAAKINKYIPVSDAIWAQQPSWTQNGNVEGAVASVLSKTEMDQLRKLMKDPAVVNSIEAGIKSDMALAAKLPLVETPTVIIMAPGQQPMKVGGISYDLLKRFVTGGF